MPGRDYACKSSPIEECQFIMTFARTVAKSWTVKTRNEIPRKNWSSRPRFHPHTSTRSDAYIVIRLSLLSVADIQEFYELTLLDESKSVQQKTAETIRIADKWEASDGPITPTFAQNDVSIPFLSFLCSTCDTRCIALKSPRPSERSRLQRMHALIRRNSKDALRVT